MIGLIAAVMAAVTPLPPPRSRVSCPFTPIFFENGRHDLDEAGRNVIANSYDWVLDRARDDVWIVLTTQTREPRSDADADIANARAVAVRAAFAAEGVPADHIMIAHDFREGPNFAPEGWVGGWVYPDFYVSPSVARVIMPSNGAIC